MRILIVEDDDIIAVNIKEILNQAAFVADICGSVAEAEIKSLSGEYDLAIVDWMLPDGEGLDLIKIMRDEHILIPILMLTAKSQTDDLVSGLNGGADDYVTKPFEASVLVARINALLRRPTEVKPEILTVGKVSLEPNNRVVRIDQRQINLTNKEYGLLYYLMMNKNQAISRADLYAHVWDEQADLLSNSVDVYIRFLRKKLGAPHSQLIQTVKGFGYKLCET